MSKDRLQRLRQLVEKKPHDPFAKYALALELKNRGELDQAVLEFGRLVSEFPDYVPAYFQFGQALIDSDDLDQARKVLETGITFAQKAGDDHAVAELRRPRIS